MAPEEFHETKDYIKYPRQNKQIERPRPLMEYVDATLSYLLIGIVITLLILNFFGEETLIDKLLVISSWPYFLGLIPAALLRKPTIWAMLGVTVVSCPCGWGAYVVCDITTSAGNIVLHPLHQWMPLLTLYGLIRVIQISITKWRSTKGKAHQ